MTEQVDTGRRRVLGIYAWVGGSVLLLGALVVMTLFRGGGTAGPNTGGNEGPTSTQENHLAAVRTSLAREVDLGTCRTVVGQLNSHLQGKQAGSPLPTSKVEDLRSALGLDSGDVEELTTPTFTALDAFHLETCFLLRDAARSLELVPPGGRGGKHVQPTPLERATVAFAWVCRQVRLSPSPDPLPAPPAFVLRRGSGSALERAVVFVALLEQFGLLQDSSAGLQGCLLAVPGKKGDSELWACGVTPAGEPDAVYLFDPRLGLPLPGPGGQGVASLKQAREDASVLAQLKVGTQSYDVTAERAKLAEPAVYAPLSALSARMRHLQERLLRDREIDGRSMPPAVRGKLAEEEPGALDAVRKAITASGGKAESVRYWKEGGTLLRRFVPKEEGGADTGVTFPVSSLRGFSGAGDQFVARLPRSKLLQMASVPWEDFPPVFHEPRFRFDQPIGQGIRAVYAAPFLRWMADPTSPREQILRGQLSRAMQPLVAEQQQWISASQRRMEPAQMEKGIEQWAGRAVQVYVKQIEAGGPGNDAALDAEVNRLWRWRLGEPMDVLMSQSIAEVRGSEVTYQLALCKHEQAVRLQARLNLAERAGVKTEEDGHKAREAWHQAVSSWGHYLGAHGKRPASRSAQRMLGEAQMRLGEREAAAKAWAASAEGAGEAEKLGALWLAKGVEGK